MLFCYIFFDSPDAKGPKEKVDKKRITIDEKDIWNLKIDFSFSEGELKTQNLGKRETEEDLQFFDPIGYLLKFKKHE